MKVSKIETMHFLAASLLVITTLLSTVTFEQQSETFLGKSITSSNLTDSLFKTAYIDTDE
jgi:hypothetical protein